MGIIYKIENVITHKVYIGQTKYALDKRWKQHIRESKAALDGIRQSFPLFHRMIIKYGEDNFITSILEECDDALLNDREKYWITKYNSYKDGYNGTCGGQDIFLSHSQKVSEFSLTGEFIRTFESAKDAAKEKQVAPANIRQCCNEKYKTCANSIWQWGEETVLKREIVLNNKYRPVRQLDKMGNPIRDYPSIAEAARAVGGNKLCILKVCNGKQKTSAGYKWEYI